MKATCKYIFLGVFVFSYLTETYAFVEMFVATENIEPSDCCLRELEIIKDVGPLAAGLLCAGVCLDTAPVLPSHGLVVAAGLGLLRVSPFVAGVGGGGDTARDLTPGISSLSSTEAV